MSNATLHTPVRPVGEKVAFAAGHVDINLALSEYEKGAVMNPFDAQAEFEDERFKGIILEAAHVQDKHFYNCLFLNCSFCETEFRRCRFVDCTFQGCDLSMVRFGDSSFAETRFVESKAVGINWALVAWPRYTLESPIRFKDCVLNYSTFIGLALRKISFEGCTANDVDFSEADLTEADFANAVLTKSRFRQTNLTRANFVGATEYSIDITANTVTKAKFSFPEAITLLYSVDICLIE
jgi:fluoroquinolone resistance protein